MYPFKKLLIALDLTPHDEEMMAYVEGFSKALLPDEILMLHVSPHSQLPDESFGSKKDKEAYLKASEERVREEMQKLKTKYFGQRSDVDISIKILHGNPLKQLLAYCEDYMPDLLMVGKKKTSGGSGVVSQKLARRVDSSILFITERAKYPIKKILIPTDYSDNSKQALSAAVNLHPLLNDPELHCLNVYEVPPGLAIQIGRTPEQFDEIVKENAEEAMDKFLANDKWKHVEIEKAMVKTRRGSPARQIMDYAEVNHMGLIILGARGHTMLETLLIGSTTEKLLRCDNDIPIMIIR